MLLWFWWGSFCFDWKDFLCIRGVCWLNVLLGLLNMVKLVLFELGDGFCELGELLFKLISEVSFFWESDLLVSFIICDVDDDEVCWE